MNIPLDKNSIKYSYKEYKKIEEKLRCELIDGVVYDMTPAPSRKHQEISGELFRQFANYLQGRACRVYHPPFDVLLPNQNEKEEDIATIVQPDLGIVMVYTWVNGSYGRNASYSKENLIKVGIFEDLTIDLKDILQDD